MTDFDLNDWASSFNPDLDRPSPDFNAPEWAHRLMHDVPKLVYAAKLRPPFGMDEEDWLSDLRETLLKRSRSPKSKWSPARGRTTWSSWCTLVCASRSMNIYRQFTSARSRITVLCTSGMMESGYLESWSGDGVGIQSGTPKHLRAKAAQQRERRARLKAASLGVV